MAPLHFAFWVPNVSRGLVNSMVPQRTSHDLDYNVKLAQIAEEKGFTFALTQIRFMSAHDGDEQYEVGAWSVAKLTHQSVSYSHALLAQTKKLNVIAAILPGPWHPALTAKTFASIDHYTGGRVSINVVSGWYKQEQAAMGVEWPEVSSRRGARAELMFPARRPLRPLDRVHSLHPRPVEREVVLLRRAVL